MARVCVSVRFCAGAAELTVNKRAAIAPLRREIGVATTLRMTRHLTGMRRRESEFHRVGPISDYHTTLTRRHVKKNSPDYFGNCGN